MPRLRLIRSSSDPLISATALAPADSLTAVTKAVGKQMKRDTLGSEIEV
jgi:hypothetical protein